MTTIEAAPNLVKPELKEFIENKINSYAERIKILPQRADRLALGELEFYIALRNVISFPRQIFSFSFLTLPKSLLAYVTIN